MRGSRTTGSDRLAPADPSAKAASGGKGVGRPRRLTTEQVLQAAVEIGLEQLTMSAVARRLGVSITVLYGYVSSRDELLRLAAAHASRRHRFPEGAGLSWPLYVARYAASLFALLTSPGHSIAHYVTLGVGPSAEIDNAEAWMETLACKGFTAHEAHILQRQMGEIVLGGAVAYLHHRRLERPGADFAAAARQAIASRDPADIPHLVSEGETFARRAPIWPRTLLQVLATVAAERDDKLDVDELTGVLEAAAPG